MSLAAGTRLGPYEVLGLIGAGGMGEVYKARDTRLDRTVAIKILPAELSADPERRARFEREARAIASLAHPHICTLHDVGTHPSTGSAGSPQAGSGQATLYLVMEHLAGETLAKSLRRGPLPLAQALDIAAQIADALDAAHKHGIIHRDLKPGNVMLTSGGAGRSGVTSAKLLDFGLAKLTGHGERHALVGDAAAPTMTAPVTARGTILGTLQYMAPEQLEGKEADARTDLWALGAVLYEMLTGERAFEGSSHASVIAAILDRDPPPVSSRQQTAPPALDRLVQRCLAKDPDGRWDSGHDIADELRWIEDTSSGKGPVAGADARAHGNPPATAIRPGLRRWWPAALVLVAVAAAGWFALARFTQPALAFKERDFIVVADVVNETGEPVFDLALKTAIETDLRQSRYVNVLDPSQAQNALRMMRLSPDARITPEIGRDICRRAGASALLVPRIMRAGNAYQIQAALVEPPTGRTADEVLVTARGREEVLLSSIDSLTRQLRKRLGESLATLARTDPPFAQYTTSSLEALQLLVIGQRAWAVGDFPKAERSFREALQRDPRFAMARGSLGLILIQFLNRPDEGRKMLEQALQEEGKVSEREYLHLRALNKQFVTQDLQGALDDYRFISELYPDLMPPYNNSGRILEQLRRPEEAAAMYERAHKADPRSVFPLYNLWFLTVRRLKDPVAAERTARTLVALQPDHAGAAHTLAWSLVASRRFSEAEEAMRAVLKLDPFNEYAIPNLGHLQFRRGAFAEAVRTYQEVLNLAGEGRLKTGTEDACLSLGLAEAAAGQTADARRTLLEGVDKIRAGGRKTPLTPDLEALVAAMLAGAGRRAEAQVIARQLAPKALRNSGLSYELARVWAVLGDRTRAIGFLEAAFAAGYADTYFVLVDPPLASVQDDPAIERLAPHQASRATQ